MEAQIEANKEQLVTSARLSALGMMAGGIAHEINNPLGIIHALASDLIDLVKEEGSAPPAMVSRNSTRIRETADRIARIIKSLRQISREGSSDKVQSAPIGKILEETLEVCRAWFKANEVKLLLPKHIPELNVYCREVQIGQILLNLLQNAFDAVVEQKDERWVRLDVTSRDDSVVISVTDSGPGIPPELRPRIMEPFFTTKPIGKGTGLGLSLSKNIAEEHGGRLEYGEDDGQELAFLLVGFPWCGNRSRYGTKASSAILVVDDEPFLREIMAGWLARVAGHVLSAEDGAEALKVLAANKIDLILSDIRMPVMDGMALLKKIKETGVRTPEVIFLTGFSDVPLREAYDMGAEAVLEKPISREELLDIAKRALMEADELWRNPPCAALETKLEMTFSSLAAAMKENRIGFGRRGFCIDSAAGLSEGPVEFTMEFEDDRLVLSGQGVVRWTAPKEGKAGIEITCLRDGSRTWMVDHLKRNKPLAFIPGFVGRDSSLRTKVA